MNGDGVEGRVRMSVQPDYHLRDAGHFSEANSTNNYSGIYNRVEQKHDVNNRISVDFQSRSTID